MISLEKLPKNGGDLGKLIVAKGFKKLPKVQKIARSGHTGCKGKYHRLASLQLDWIRFNQRGMCNII